MVCGNENYDWTELQEVFVKFLRIMNFEFFIRTSTRVPTFFLLVHSVPSIKEITTLIILPSSASGKSFIHSLSKTRRNF